MYTFTDSYGNTITPDADAIRNITEHGFLASDVRHLPVLLKAANAADDAGYCSVYDDIARNIGAPTRDDMREAGLLQRTFTVTGSRTVTVSFDIDIPFEVEVEASRPADIRDGDIDLNDYFESDSITGETIRDAVNRYAYFDAEVEGSYEVDHVRGA